MTKVILLNLDPNDYILACRVVKWMVKQPPNIKDGILDFDDHSAPMAKHTFYVRRNKASITVRKIP